MNENNTVSRRGFLKAAAAVGAGVAVAGSAACIIVPAFAETADDGTVAQYGFLMDTQNCVNCQNCALACRNYNEIPDSEEGRRIVREFDTGAGERVWVSSSCMHCESPSCATVCPAGAISKGEGGVVVVDKSVCIGCKYCYQACPYGVPNYNEHGMDKCDCCLGCGVALGDSPHCVDACRFDALHYGPIDELAAAYEGRAQRIVGSTMPSCYLA